MTALYNLEDNPASSLFERIQGKSSGSSQRAKIQALLMSIKQNLNQVLNSKPLGCQSTPALGIPDLNDATLTGVDFKVHLSNIIADCITTYEPRITNVTVHFIENEAEPLSLQFNITAFLLLENQKQLIEFNVQLDSNRRYQLTQF
ncbi:type VI secretion system baseplate subunit TssE [Proteus sp. CD3]|uniref:type VI secretion system baseplate subunit TssE n=1 Tax=Proteus sp. CD3 TaxID=1921565 RepID=UPI00124A9399|nr:type VI secretion system baseplate subunit TssE [Proteus sp. CD3]QEZ93087.1 lysozyme [Proteus sp. CD3]